MAGVMESGYSENLTVKQYKYWGIKMKKNGLITVLVVITIFCVIGGTFYHMSGFWNWWGRNDFDAMQNGTSKSMDLNEFTSIDIDAYVMDLTIREGDNYFVEYQYTQGLEPVCKIDKGTLKITQSKHKRTFFWGFNSNNCKVQITVPSKTELQDLRLQIDVGNINIADIISEKCNMETDTGDCKVTKCSFKRSTIDTDTGDVSVDNSELGITQVSSDVGDIELENCTFRDLEADSDVGNIRIDAAQDLSDYRMELKTDVGDVHINDQKEKRNYYEKGNNQGNITAQTDVGDIILNYREN